MSDTFSFNRFWNYFRYDLKTLRGNLGIMVLLLGLVPIIAYVFFMLFGGLFSGDFVKSLLSDARMDGPSLGVRIGIFIGITLLFAIIFPSRAYGFLTEKKAGASWLLLPASRGEKFISMLLCSLVIVPAVYFLLYLGSDQLVCWLDRTCGDSLLTMKLGGPDGFLLKGPHDGSLLVANGFWIVYAIVAEYAAIFLLGGLLFRKWKIVGTIAALFVLNTLFTVLASTLIGHVEFNITGEKIAEWAGRHADSLDFWLNGLIDLKVGLVLAACAVGVWFRLKTLKH